MTVKATSRRRRRLRIAQGGICPYCGEVLSGEAPHGRFQTADHVLPVSAGFQLDGNALCVHADCNVRKADRPPTGCELLWLHAVNARLGLAA